jgi:hypothetical protein
MQSGSPLPWKPTAMLGDGKLAAEVGAATDSGIGALADMAYIMRVSRELRPEW